MTYIHAILVDFGSGLKESLDSIKDCYIVDVISKDVNCSVDLVVKEYDRYLTIIKADAEYKKEINKLVEKTDSDYIVILNSGKVLDNITDKLEKYGAVKKLSMLKDKDLLIVKTNVWRWLLGFGEQDVDEKVNIAAKNENLKHLVLNSLEELCLDQPESLVTV